MNIIREKFLKSAQTLKKPQNLAICGMLLALRILLGYFSNLTLAITPDIKIGLTFLPIAIAGILCGPVASGAIGALGDLICFMLVPMGAYFPGWTLNGLLVGILYGMFLYESKRFVPSLVICEVVSGIFVEIALGSLWLYIQFSKAFWITAGIRSIKTFVAIPIEIAVIILFEKTVIKQLEKRLKRRRL
ncbi:MAG: folate family ECF transporter S component [Ruminococcus sp.]|nr:folate family ECF transporter S component [Ruminococcus sp.]